jgi:1,4-alpha-glucan branching enzyme
VIGSFNQWSPNGYALRRDDRTGRWVLEAPLPPGRYEYSFLIDGRRTRPDPNAAITTDDGFGNRNSVLYVRGGASI